VINPVMPAGPGSQFTMAFCIAQSAAAARVETPIFE